MAYTLTTVKVRFVGEPPARVIAGPLVAVEHLRAIFATLDADREHFLLARELLYLPRPHRVREAHPHRPEAARPRPAR